MRRQDRAITAPDELLAVMEQADVCRLILNGDDGFPYVVPLNFGHRVENGRLVLYFHGTNQGGRKYELMKKDDRAAFEMDIGHRLVPRLDEQACTMEYESVIGRGRTEPIDDDDAAAKRDALRLILDHYHLDDFPINEKAMAVTATWRLVVDSYTGKRRKVK